MRDKNTTPPKLAQWLLALSVAWRFKEEAENDLDELYQIRLENWGEKYARKQYWNDVLSIWARRSWFRELEFTNLNTFAMLKNYLKVTFRTLRKQKIYSFINVFGLAIGLAFCALIYLYVQDEFSFDRFHENADRIYRAEKTMFNPDGSILRGNRNNSIPLGPSLQEQIPGIEAYTRIFNRSHYVRTSGEAINEQVYYADPELFDIFSFPFISGNPETALKNLSSVVVSEETAIKYFGTENALGKVLQIRKNDVYEDFEVTGVVENIPSNSTIRFSLLLNVQGDGFYNEQFLDNWNMNIYRTYLLLNENTDPNSLNTQLDTFFDKYHEGFSDAYKERFGLEMDARAVSYRFNPLTDIHLSSASDPMYSFILSGIALGILFIACINFMTLSIGRSSKRSKEIGMRKVVGAFRQQLMFQFWGEAFIICTISLIVGLILAESFLPVFNSLSGKSLEFSYLDNWTTLLVLIGFIVVTGFIAGSYPAVILSKVKPVVTLKGMLKLNGSNLFTKSLVVVQFSLSVWLIISTLVMRNQLEFIQNRDLGFDKEQVVVIPLDGIDGREIADQFRNTISQNTSIIDVTTMGNSLGRSGSYGYGIEHNGRSHVLNVFTIESNYSDFMGIDLVDGRIFNPDLSTDTLQAVLVNETLVTDLGLENPIGQVLPGLSIEEDDDHAGAIIVGIVRDHNFQSLYIDMQPAFFSMNPSWGYDNLMVRIQPDNMQETITLLGNTWQQFVPQIPFAYSFLDDDLQQVYQNDNRWTTIINYASFFAIMIACLGLFGLVTLTVTSRQKEVGIRKVLGASISQITTLFAKDFILLVLIGVLIASPVAWYFMNEWLTNFAYRISVNGWHFAVATVLVLIIALLTISFQTIRAGTANPVDTLMNE